MDWLDGWTGCSGIVDGGLGGHEGWLEQSWVKTHNGDKEVGGVRSSVIGIFEMRGTSVCQGGMLA